MLKLLHVNNMISPHQLPLAASLATLVGPDCFRYAALRPPMPDRQAMGWNCETDHPWVLRAGERQEDREEFRKWWTEADVVMCGERLLDPIKERLRSNRLVFYTSERWWKPPLGMVRMLSPRFARMATQFRRLAASPHLHLLAIGPQAAVDMKRLASFPDRMWRWGYFTRPPERVPPVHERNAGLKILYAGRMLSWKRVDTLVRAFHLLRQRVPTAQLALIGDGPSRPALEDLAGRLRLGPSIGFQSSMVMEDIRGQMRGSHIFVLPSNSYEGWGAVVNEAMSEGCAVVASEAAGSAGSMIRDGMNGCVFCPGDWRQLGQIMIRLAQNEPWRLKIAAAGQHTMAECWSPRIAAERFLSVVHALLARQAIPFFSEGPMTPA